MPKTASSRPLRALNLWVVGLLGQQRVRCEAVTELVCEVLGAGDKPAEPWLAR
jgi:hypothetical protein